MWPPIGIEPVNPFELPLLNTVILLSSGATVTWAHHSLIEGERTGSLYGSVATVLLAVVFTIFQGIEYSVSSFTISDGAFGTCFFFGTGFHGYVSNILFFFYGVGSPLITLKEEISNINNYKKFNVLHKRFYSTNIQSKLSPYWVTGFAALFIKPGIRLFSTTRSCTNNNLSCTNKNLSLVIWGTNLTSLVGTGRFTKQVNSMINLTYYSNSVVIGLLLSDGWLVLPAKRSINARLGFKQSLYKAGYVLFVFNALSHYCSISPYLVGGVRAGNRYYALEFFTRTLPCFTPLYYLFYPNKTKVIPSNIYELLTPVAMAHLIMGDGQTSRHGLVLCTNSYSIQDVVRLMNVLMIRYKIECNIREFTQSSKKLEYMIYIKHGSMPLLRTIVEPYMHESMLYKLYNYKANSTTSPTGTSRYPLSKDYGGVPTVSLKVLKKNNSKLGGEACCFSSVPKLSVFVNKRLFSTLNLELNPYWVTGFCDAESSYSLKVSKKISSKSGWNVIPEFRIELHSRDTFLIRKIHSYFGIGNISLRKDRNIVVYSVQSYRDIINVLIPHFDKYPLITQKKADYLLFKQGVELLNLKAKSSIEGIRQILSLKGSMNSGLSETLITQFPTVLPEPRPLVCFQGIPDPNWITGFVDGEGCFYVKVKKNKTYSIGFQIIISFSISQHIRDELLLSKFIDYLGCGVIEKVSTRRSVVFVVYKFGDVFDKIIPFFQRFPLQGIKSMDYIDFSEVAKLIKDKSHLTHEGLKKIKSLKSGMNTGRIDN
jgi:hypothetical protein